MYEEGKQRSYQKLRGGKMAERVISPGTFPSGWAGASSNPGASNEG